ncbi:hypothetical protein L1987_89187 [Smallanthus sonchifolius]|nr:hypothetical protein L1987_89187 [Smallanthus sonchifolius]
MKSLRYFVPQLGSLATYPSPPLAIDLSHSVQAVEFRFFPNREREIFAAARSRSSSKDYNSIRDRQNSGKLERSYAKIFIGSRLFLTAMAIHLSLRVAPLDLQQGGNSRIPYVHVPRGSDEYSCLYRYGYKHARSEHCPTSLIGFLSVHHGVVGIKVGLRRAGTLDAKGYGSRSRDQSGSQSHFTQRSALLFAFILVTYRSEDLMLSLNAYRTAILRYRPLSVVLACSLKLIWCCLVPSVCSDSDEGYYIPPTQLPCLVVQNGSLDERFTVSGSIRQSHPEGANESLNSNESGLFLFDSSKSTIESIKLGRFFSPSAGRLPSFPCLAGYLKPAFEPTKPSRTAIVLLALRLESLNYRLNLPIGGVDYSLTTIIENRSKSRKHSQEVGLEASYSGLLVGQAGPPSSLRSNPSRQLWQPVLIALALIPVRGASARGKIAQTYIQGKDLRILYKKGKISKSRLGTSNRRIRKEERRVEKKGNGILHKGRERKGDSTKKSEKGSKEGTHLDRATTGDRIWKEINMFSRTNRFTPSMTAHQGNNGQSRQRQARMLLPTRPIQGNLTLCAENPSHFRQRGNDDG